MPMTTDFLNHLHFILICPLRESTLSSNQAQIQRFLNRGCPKKGGFQAIISSCLPKLTSGKGSSNSCIPWILLHKEFDSSHNNGT